MIIGLVASVFNLMGGPDLNRIGLPWRQRLFTPKPRDGRHHFTEK